METEHITVKSGRDDDRVALWEAHPDHPDGEIFVAGENEVEVARTRRVEAALRKGVLVEAGEEAEPTTATVGPVAERHPMTATEAQAETGMDAGTAEGTVGGIADYDNLTVSEVISRRDGLSDAQRLDVRTYEMSHKNRRGIMDTFEE